MQPAWSRYVRRESAPPPARSAVTRVTRGAAPVERTAGTVAPQVLDGGAPLSLPTRANFGTDVWGDAMWLSRAPGAEVGPATLYVSSGARVLRDVRGECGLAAEPLAWSADLFAALGSRLATAGVPSNLLPDGGRAPMGGPLPRGWLAWALWYTYDREAFPRDQTVVLPNAQSLTMPNVNGLFPPGSGARPTGALNGFDPALYAESPFTQFDVVGGSGGGATPAGAGGGSSTWLLVLAAAAAALND